MRPSPISVPASAGLGLSVAEKTTSSLSALGPRIISSAVLGPLVLGAVYWGGWPYNIMVGVAALILAAEWSRMVGRRAAWMAFGVVYIALTCWALWRLRLDPETGRLTIFWLLAVVWGADIGGYVFGMALRGPKLCPSISPGKTWAGFIGGTLSAALAGWGVGVYAMESATLAVAGYSAAIAVVSQAGDLFESWVKRRFGVKDSGAIIPGHGGLFDRIDGLVAAALAVTVINLSLKGNVLTWL